MPSTNPRPAPSSTSDPTSVPEVAFPGLLLAQSAHFASGPGTHVLKAPSPSSDPPAIYASIPGPVLIDQSTTPPTICIPRCQTAYAAILHGGALYKSTSNGLNGAAADAVKATDILRTKNNVLPAVGSVVLGRVTKVSQRQATLDILVVDSEPAISSSATSTLNTSPESQGQVFQGIIRREDIKAVDKDRVVVEQSFRVGDVVRGVIVSLGDAGGAGGYYISTARDELGVVMGRKEGKGLEGMELKGKGARGRGKGGWMWGVNWKEMVDGEGGREERKVAKPV
jgi:exosome complex component CSL4